MSFIDHPQTVDDAKLDVPKKRTRRRLRVSCVECTRRRQKCDRQQPCSLCKTRGVEHLCRWETEPYARPPPARPPGRAATRKEKPADLITSWQISNVSSAVSPYISPVNQGLLQWRNGVSSPSTASIAGSISRTSLSPLERPNEGLKEAALALARMQITEKDHRLGEGSLACALQELTDSVALNTFELPLTGLPHSFALVRSSEPFIPRLPDKAHCDALLMSFHEHVNWSIGIPHTVLFSSHEAMWNEIRADPNSLQRFNPNWLALLFAIFAFSPACGTEEESRNYFNQALAARKLEEDKYSLDAPMPSIDTRGAVYTCLATAFLARYLQDRGRVTEAWRVVGSGLRDAQNAGLHRYLAPGKSKHLTNDERTFMLVSWHLCVEFDRYLSLFLGRPTVVRSRDCNVQLPSVRSDVLSPNGTTNTALLFQCYFISLTKVVSEAKEKFLSEFPDSEDGHAYFDSRMVDWLANLPGFYKLDQPPDSSYDHLYPKLYLQRLTLNSYYSCSCLLFHRSLAYAHNGTHNASGGYEWDQSHLAQYAINVLHAQSELMLNQWWERQVPFDISMYMFEAAVTLGVTLLRYLHHPRAEVWRTELAIAIEVLESLRAKDFGRIVVQAIQVLRVLQDLCNDSKAKSTTAMMTTTMTFADPSIVQEEAKYYQMEGFNNSVPLSSSHSYGTEWFQQPVHNMDPAGGAAASSSGVYPTEESQYASGYPVWLTDSMAMPNLGPEGDIRYV